ncbi:MAG: ROK family protein [Anaerolineales bacterium]|nr:ROK family protein [Anaerolineales bacterium]
MVNIVGQTIKEQKVALDSFVVGVGFPSMVDTMDGRILKSSALPEWNNVLLVELLKRELLRPVFVENDVNAAAYGEWTSGAAVGAKNVVYLNLGTGVGAAFILNGALYRGISGAAGELGYVTHIVENPNGKKIQKNLYSLISGKSLSTQIIQHSELWGIDKILRDLCQGKYENVNVEVIARDRELGSKIASQILEQATTVVGMTVSNLLNLFDPELIVIGGGISRLGNWFIKKTIEEASKYVNPAIDNIPIVASKLEPYSGAIGVAALASTELRKR